MATKKPRVQVTLEPVVYETLTRLAALQGCSRSSLISGLLDAVHPPLMRTVAIIEAAAEAPSDVVKGLQNTVTSIHSSIAGNMGSSIAQMDFLLESLSEAPPESQTPSGVGSGPPVPVTRGSGMKKQGLTNTGKGVRRSKKKGVKRG